MSELIFPLLFFFIAFVYSSAGFGGGSMYLAVLAESSWPAQVLKFTGLLCNAVVTGNGTLRFLMQRWVSWKKSRLILVVSVIPCMLTSAFPLSDRWYMLTLGCALCVAAFAIAISPKIESDQMHVQRWWIFPASALIGALAGVTGIGGGVYLAPLLYLTRWGSPKEIAGLTSIFILVNSAAGLIIQYVCFTITIP
ncbi:MAG: sulfite exporter TauE/SafE family protein, partial [Flavobacteriales bacterium]